MATKEAKVEIPEVKKETTEVKKPAKEKAKAEVEVRESSLIELMHQRGITREEAIEVYRNAE